MSVEETNMALVAYEYSDSSDIDEDETLDEVEKIKDITETSAVSASKSQKATQIQVASIHPSTSSTESDNLFTLLPQPAKTKITVVEDDDEFLHKKEVISKLKAKITVPSLSDFKDVEITAPSARPKASNGKKSGLLSMLPQPRNAVPVSTTTKSFVPHILTRKPPSTVKKKEPLPSPAQKIKQDLKTLTTQYSDESDDDQEENDFFSINKTVDPIPVADVPLDIDEPKVVRNTDTLGTEKKVRDIQSYFKQDNFEEPDVSQTNSVEVPTGHAHHQNSSSSHETDYQAQPSNSNEVVLDEEAILKLCGSRGKRKREEIQIVDVNQQDVLADAREWLLKGLMDDTTKRVSASKRRGDEPTSQQRRKHQITYLAHQAKANEAELQNQWANNRQSKRQTQSKYGF